MGGGVITGIDIALIIYAVLYIVYVYISVLNEGAYSLNVPYTHNRAEELAISFLSCMHTDSHIGVKELTIYSP